MGLIARFWRLIKSNINDLLGRAEDPEKILNQIVLDMQEQLSAAKSQVGVAIADEKRLAKQYHQKMDQTVLWRERAKKAVQAEDDKLAKEALARMKEEDNLATQFEEQWKKQDEAVQQLKQQLRVLSDKIGEAKRKKNILIARKKRADATQTIQSTMDGMRSGSSFDSFNEMAEKIEQIEAEAEAGMELSSEFSGDLLDEKFRRLDSKASADDELAALKADMGLIPKTRVDEEDAAAAMQEEELESLKKQHVN